MARVTYYIVIYLVISIAVLLLVGCLLWWYGKTPARHKLLAQGDFKKFLEALLYRGYDGGFLVIEAPTKERFIQFLKYIKSKGNVGLQFDFPRAPWSEKYFETLKELLDQQGYHYSIEISTVPTLVEQNQLFAEIV